MPVGGADAVVCHGGVLAATRPKNGRNILIPKKRIKIRLVPKALISRRNQSLASSIARMKSLKDEVGYKRSLQFWIYDEQESGKN